MTETLVMRLGWLERMQPRKPLLHFVSVLTWWIRRQIRNCYDRRARPKVVVQSNVNVTAQPRSEWHSNVSSAAGFRDLSKHL